MKQKTASFAALAIILSSWSMNALPAKTTTVESAAHDTYLAAINSNDVDTLMADLTDDVVYQSPNEPEIVGKDAVRRWAAQYVGAYRIEWKKTSIGFTVAGEWAFERYTYESKDVEKATGAVSTDHGKGINIFRRGKDGKWRVAVDGWSSDKPAGP